jgi:hypothetical protein
MTDNLTTCEYFLYRLRRYAYAHKTQWRGRFVFWVLAKTERGVVRSFLLSKLEQEAQVEATEMVRQVAHNMTLSGKPTSAASQELQIAQLTAELLQEKLLSKKERE